ncbi:MAG: 2-C-methyl-D-erythritol 2,4-cyclodiphosphate synthase [Eggerthellaceae bacterium]|nr:2-C-methyl-D-erythritol 2,4-cyclodiphosphate synthase [Eggerthellaceae bacterium]
MAFGFFKNLRIGNGYDVHAFVEGRKLILGGIEIGFELGLDGHSDADVLLHAISDALVSAARIGDIGRLFPDNDPKYKDADSLELLKTCVKKVNNLGFKIVDIDATIIAQAPKLSSYHYKMRLNVADACGIELDNVGISATTTEGLGLEGRGEGMSASASCILYKVN